MQLRLPFRSAIGNSSGEVEGISWSGSSGESEGISCSGSMGRTKFSSLCVSRSDEEAEMGGSPSGIATLLSPVRL